MNFLEISATLFGLLQGYLVMLNKRSNWIAYIIQMLLMFMFSLSVQLYGDALNNICYIFVGIVGFVVWNKKDLNDIKKCSTKERIIYIAVMIIATFLGMLLLKKTDDPLPLIDAFTTVSSFIATYYMITKRIDTWAIWFINDIFYCIAYLLLPTPALYLFILNLLWSIMAIASYINWKKIMLKNEAS